MTSMTSEAVTSEPMTSEAIYITIEIGLCNMYVCVFMNSSETARPIKLKLGEDVGLEASRNINYF